MDNPGSSGWGLGGSPFGPVQQAMQQYREFIDPATYERTRIQIPPQHINVGFHDISKPPKEETNNVILLLKDI